MALDDTAQPQAAETDPNAAIAQASDAFKAFTVGEPIEKPRDDRGRFASAAEPEEEIEAEGEPEAPVNDDEPDDEPEAAEEAQPDAVEMPTSWSKEDAELWEALPPETQAKLAEREGERERAIGSKFQEAANLRRDYDTRLSEANNNRDRYAAAIDQVLGLVELQRPDPRTYGAGTGNYDRESYDLALAQYEQQSTVVDQLTQQRQELAAQQTREMEERAAAAREAIEEKWRPAFMAAVPDITDPTKGQAVLTGLVEYAVSNGIPSDLFADAQQAKAITSAELLILHKAMAYDRMQAAKGKVQSAPAPKPATPTARPGAAISRSAQRQTQFKRDSDRLSKEGSIDAGAAVFRHFLK